MYGFERINLSFEGGGCCGNAGIDPHKPAVMDNYLNDEEWDAFCDRVNGAIKPIHVTRKFAMGAFTLTFIAFLVVMGSTFVTFDLGESSSSSGPILFVIPVAMMLLTICLFVYGSIKAKRIQREIQSICDELSARQPQLLMTVRYDASYAASDVRARASQYIDVTSTSGQSDHGKSSAKQLAQLEKVKDKMTKREYDAKKSEIAMRMI
jgi:hypothetical protein